MSDFDGETWENVQEWLRRAQMAREAEYIGCGCGPRPEPEDADD